MNLVETSSAERTGDGNLDSRLSSELEIELVLGRELETEVVDREAVGEVLPPAPLELETGHHVLDGIPEQVRARVLSEIERLGKLTVAVADVEPRVTDRGRELVAPVNVVVGDHPEDRK